MKIGAVIALVSALSMGTGWLGIRSSAPDPEVVKSTAADVSEIKTELAKLNVLLSTMATNDTNLQRQIDAQQQAIDALKETVPKAREVDELRRRIERLENERK